MARPKKEGLDYFPLDVDTDQDDKVALIEAKHGLQGFAVIVKLFMKIYKNGYFYKWTEKEQLLFSNRINVDINTLNAIVNDCLEWNLFNRAVFDKYQILTSIGIQSRYFEAIGRRKEIVLNKDFLLVDPKKHLGNSKINLILVDSNEKGVNEDINSVKEDINPQRKVEERKVEDIDDDKGMEYELNNPSKPNPITEYEKYFATFPSSMLIEQINHWIDKSQFKEPEAIICETIRRIKLESPRNPAKYLNTTLSNLHNLRLYTLAAVQEYNAKFDRKTLQKRTPQQLPKSRPAHWIEPSPLTEEEKREMAAMQEEFPF